MAITEAQHERGIAAAAAALYNHQLRGAREDIDRTAFEAKELPTIFSKLQTESETAQVLVFASYLEDRVRSLLKVRLHHLTSLAAENAMFGMNGPFSTFGNQIALSYHLGWVSPRQKKKLDAFRKIRNEFAHRAFKIGFSDPSIADRMGVIDSDVRAFLKPIRDTFVTAGDPDPFLPDEEITKPNENLCNLALLAHNTFTDYLVLPAAIAFRVDPHDVVKTFDESPRIVQDLRRQMTLVVFNLFERRAPAHHRC